MAEKWAKTSAEPSSGAMKPKPLSALNHFTVPVAIVASFHESAPRLSGRQMMQQRASCVSLCCRIDLWEDAGLQKYNVLFQLLPMTLQTKRRSVTSLRWPQHELSVSPPAWPTSKA